MIELKKMKRWAVFGMCIAWLLTLLGCGKEKPFMLDGPEMEYQSPWTAFTLSRSDSDPQYNFSFTVTDNGEQALVTGECNDENGNSTIQTNDSNIPTVTFGPSGGNMQPPVLPGRLR